MEDPRESFWPSNFDVDTEITPLTILREQAALLGERTKNLVEGRVQTKVDEKMEIRHSLYLVVPNHELSYFPHITRGRSSNFRRCPESGQGS